MCNPSEEKNLRAAFVTLGCKLNFAETSSLRDRLAEAGILPVERDGRADVCIINTCSVTETADQKCRQAIHRLHREHPGAAIIVVGCYAQLQPGEIARMEGVDLVLGMEQKGQVPERIHELLARKADLQGGEACHEAVAVPTRDIRTFVPSCSCGDRTRYFLKVQDGCNYYCTYCTIPIARGRSRNAPIADLVKTAEQVAREGGREIVITGVNIGDFGRSTGETFLDLIRALDRVEGIERFRISSIEPNLLTDEIIDFCAASRAFMPHFHIPLQSGSDAVLRLMHRHYDTALFADKVARIKQAMPDAFIGVDVIVGTRGEQAAYFEEAYRFIDGLDISQLHVFSYSERPGTKALEIPHVVSPQEKHERSHRLLELSETKRKQFYAKYRGSVRPVLWEHAREGQPMQGFTDNYIRVTAAEGLSARDNEISRTQLGEFTADGATLLGQNPLSASL